MAKAKGKVNEQSLDALKKSIKAGGKKKQTKKTPAPKPKGRPPSRSRSRSRTPARQAKKTPPPPPKKKAPPKKSTASAKVKRLDDDKSARKTARSVRASAISPGTYKLRPRIQGSEDEISSSTRLNDQGPHGLNDSSASSKSKVQNSAAVEPNRGWFSKCIIS